MSIRFLGKVILEAIGFGAILWLIWHVLAILEYARMVTA